MKKKYVIIGASAAGIGAINKLRQFDPTAEIICISAQTVLPYNKCLLADFLSEAKSEDQIRIFTEKLKAEKNIQLLLGTQVDSIHAQQKMITLGTNENLYYDSLLIATGSSVFVPPFAQKEDVRGIFTFHTLEDARAIISYIKKYQSKKIVIVGAGLSGLECADALIKQAHVTMIEMKSQVLPSLIDGQSARFIQKRMERSHIDFLNNEKVVALESMKGAITHVLLESGARIACDLMIITTGMVCNSQIARSAGITCEKTAIVTDSFMQTDKNDIYAAGDVILVRDNISNAVVPSCTWPDAMLQGAHAAASMTGNAKAYNGVNLILNSSFFGLKFSTTLTHLMACETTIKEDDNAHNKIQIENNSIIGFTLIGEHNALFSSLKKMVLTKEQLSSNVIF